jgi:hypothetical protein
VRIVTPLSTAQSGVGLADRDAVGEAVSELGVRVGVAVELAVTEALAVMELVGVWLIEAPSVLELVDVAVMLRVGDALTDGKTGAMATATSALLALPAPVRYVDVAGMAP